MRQPMPFVKSNRPIAILVPRLRIGGADSYVRDALSVFALTPGTSNLLLYVIHHDRYTPLQYYGVEVVLMSCARSVQERLSWIKQHMVDSGVEVVLLQLVGLSFLRTLWAANIRTGIIFQNEEPTWSYSPRDLQSKNVPFLVATFGAMAERLRFLAPTIPVCTIRPMPDVPAKPVNRNATKESLEVPKDTVLLGMIGAFKLHKRYTLAVRILKALRDQGVNAYLCIVGGHVEQYGGGPRAYEATLQLARHLGVTDFLRCPGEIKQAEGLYSSFDLFLNTSLYEGVSRATLSAATQGCPVLATAVGGHTEVLSPPNMTLSVDASAKEFADAAICCLNAGWQKPTYQEAICATQAAWTFLLQQLQEDCDLTKTYVELEKVS